MEDRRLIEDYLPIQAISAEASREKSVRKGHISTLHLWWARRPLVACRAAVYGALVPIDRFRPKNGPLEKRDSLARANAKKFVERLCKYPGAPQAIAEAQQHILEAHAERLTEELKAARTGITALPAWVEEFKFTGERVTVADIEGGRAPRPRVLDMFAGGGAIPLEALRLGCEAYALELNPVAHIIELCTLVYPQKYGKPDPTARGMTGPKGKDGQPTWGGLANEVRYWGEWVLKKAKCEIGDLYPPIPDPAFKGKRPEIEFDRENGEWVIKRGSKSPAAVVTSELALDAQSKIQNLKSEIPPGYLTPVAYLWTRTVTCKNPNCRATVPLVRQTWLCKKAGRCVALKMIAPRGKKEVRFEVVEARSESGLGFDPTAFSKAGNATCPFCGTVTDSDYVKSEGCAGRMGTQLMAVVCTCPREQGKVYLSADHGLGLMGEKKTAETVARLTLVPGTLPNEPLPAAGALGLRVQAYGIKNWRLAFTSRQLAIAGVFAAAVREAANQIEAKIGSVEHSKAVLAYLGLTLDKVVDRGNALGRWYSPGEKAQSPVSGGRLPMTWDFPEVNPFGGASGSSEKVSDYVEDCVQTLAGLPRPANEVLRGSATALSWDCASFDAVVTDPPYYDNVPYSNLSDLFYVWLNGSSSPRKRGDYWKSRGYGESGFQRTGHTSRS